MRPLDPSKLSPKARKPLAGAAAERAAGPDAFASRLDEADKALERVRSLHESYFLGLEKRAPEPERLDLQRRLNDLRRQGTSNTALRFRLESLVQRHIVLSGYWTRTLREIEAGTYRRDVFKAKRQAERAVHTGTPPADPPAPVPGQRPPPALGDRPSPAPPATLGNRAPPPPASLPPAAPPRGAPPPIPADALKRAAAAAIMSKAPPTAPAVRPPSATVPPPSGKR